MREIQISISTEGKESLSHYIFHLAAAFLSVRTCLPASLLCLKKSMHVLSGYPQLEVGVSIVVLVVLWAIFLVDGVQETQDIHKHPCFSGCTACRMSYSPSFQTLLIPKTPFLNSINCRALFPENLAWIQTPNSCIPEILYAVSEPKS